MPRQDKNTLFRREALDRLNDVDELDRLVTVTHPRAWLTLGVVAALIIAALVWASVGRLATTVNGQGMLLTGGRTTNVTSLQDGRLAALSVGIGDEVTKGQAVAVVTSPAAEQAVQTARMRVAAAQAAVDALEAATGPGAQELAAATDELAQAKRDLARAEAAAASGAITSPYTGTVSSLQLYPGQYVAPGAPIVTLEPVGVPLVATLYLPIDAGKKVEMGQEVQVVPATVNVDEYGYLRARVTFVAHLASTPQSMNAVLQNAFLVEAFSASGPVLRVEAALVPDAHNPSGYAWSSSSGPDMRITAGTTCSARVVLSTDPPITYAFPALQRVFGGSE